MADNPWSVSLDVDELHPFVHESRHGVSVPTSAEEVTRWRKVMADFAIVQDEMKAAYDAARALEVEGARIAEAEAEVAAAERRLMKARYDQAHPLYLPESWVEPGDDEVCQGWQYDTRDEAKAERMRVHNTWPEVAFDLRPYVCRRGHHHLRRR